MDNVRVMTRTTVTGAYDGGTYGALERVNQHTRDRRVGVPLECFWRIVAKQAVLAAGALERPIAFQNNDRPGIMTAGAVRAYVHRWGVSPGQRVTVFGNNDDAHRTALDLHKAGVHVAALIDSRQDARVEGLPFEVIVGGQVCNAAGRKGLEGITVRTPRSTQAIQTDCLAMSGGWNPSVHLTCHMNGPPAWSDAIQAFVPTPDAVPGLRAVGACNGVFSTHGGLHDGVRGATEALSDLGINAAAPEVPEAEDAPYRLRALWAVAGKGRAWLDFQNDVSVKDIQQSVAENFQSVEHMKRYTTQGMATDQGKSSNVAALAVLADATGRGIPETGTTTFRPTSHAESVARGAPMIEAGLWYRPSYFPQAGETTWREACDREVGYVDVCAMA